jgi:signal transduction histidine kinase
VIAATESSRARTLWQSPAARDLLVALAAFGLTLALLNGAHGASRHLDTLGGALAALACFPLLARRRSPLGVFVLTTAASATMNGLGYGLGPPFGPTFALFFVATDERTRSRIGKTAAVVLGMFAIHVGSTVIPKHAFPTSPILFGLLVWGGAWVIGDQLVHRRQRLVRAEQELQRERRIAVAEERTRIARDLHDSAAHAINVILVQAGAARLLQQESPAAARDALTTIEDVARDTIGEIEQLVRTLREDASNDEPEPPTGLKALDTLIERSRTAGLAIHVDTTGAPRALPAAVDQAAYRILQESLTNAARHGDGSADVEIDYRDNELALGVTNPVSLGANGCPGTGHGVLGMQERAALLGGRLDVSRDDGCFNLRARLPLP